MADPETLAPALPEQLVEDTKRMLERASAQGVTLATAESCTGGMLASLLTDVEGLSHVFDRGFVTYSLSSKRDSLGVPQSLLNEAGPVSRDVAIAMAEGALRQSDAGLALALTGFADVGDEPGLVYFACARKGKETVHREEHFGPLGRAGVRLSALAVAVNLIDQSLHDLS